MASPFIPPRRRRLAVLGFFVPLIVAAPMADGSRSALALDTAGDPAHSATGAHNFTYQYFPPGSIEYFDNDPSNLMFW